MKTVIKILNVIAWIGVGLGILMMLLGLYSGVVLTWSVLPFISADNLATYYHIANGCFLLAIALFVFLLRYQFIKK